MSKRGQSHVICTRLPLLQELLRKARGRALPPGSARRRMGYTNVLADRATWLNVSERGGTAVPLGLIFVCTTSDTGGTAVALRDVQLVR